MKKEKKSDYDLNMNDYSHIYDYNLITLRLITQLWFQSLRGSSVLLRSTNLLYLRHSAQGQPQSIFSFNQPNQQTQQQQQQQQQQQLQQQQQQQQNTSILGNQTSNAQASSNLSDVDILSSAMASASVFNDERDLILAKWNQLQAFYGHGKLFYQNQSIDITKESRYSRFKSISYNCKPQYRNEDGLVTLLIGQKEEHVKANQSAITDTLLKIFNNDASLGVKVESVKAVEEDKCELVFYVEQRTNPMTEDKIRVSATMVSNHLNKQVRLHKANVCFLKTGQVRAKFFIKNEVRLESC